jgi:tetratricopeptide (TPR) repeat protein
LNNNLFYYRFGNEEIIMKSIISLTFIWLVVCYNTQAQKATISEQKIKMKTYMFSDPDPVPDMEKNYPYFRFDGFTNNSAEREWNMVILENDFVKVYITPEIGGKIWGAIEKTTGGEFLYYNDVVKFRDVAHRGPWTSGGLEYNFGIMSHVSTCSTPQDYVLSEHPDGSVSCTVGALDLHTRTRWNVEVILPKDKAYVMTKASWFNTNNVPVSFYHYMNAAAKTEGNLEFIYPGSHHIGHSGEVGTWPIDNGRNISFYENNNFGSYKSYHVLNAYSDYMGGYWQNDNFGFGHLVDYADLPGKKLWIWGLSEQGMIWVDLLTDTKGQYIEFQSGKSFNQAMTTSSLTPFKHSEFIPYDADITTELWFPLKETGGMVAASEYGVLNVIKNGTSIKIILSALQKLDTELEVSSGSEVVKRDKVVLKTLGLYQTDIEMDTAVDFTIELGDKLLYYSSNREELIVDRPLYPNEDYDWDSAAGLYTKGLELEKQQSYIEGGHANLKAHELYLESVRKDQAFAPALNRLALSFYKRAEYEKALDYAKKSLSINTYDPEANYFFGLINKRLNKISNAKSGFSIASQSPLYRSAGYSELAHMHLTEQKFEKTGQYAQKALAYNQYNIPALEILTLVYRHQGEHDKFHKVIDKIYAYDKTSTFVKYVKIKDKNGSLSELSQLITNELPHESYMELAIKFYNYGFPEESIEILKIAPKHPIVLLWLAYLDTQHQQEWLESGLRMSPDFAFPYRDETLVMLENLMQINNDWKLSYYVSLIYWKKGCLQLARELFEQCGELPGYAPFYLAKVKLFSDDVEIIRASLDKAKSLDNDDWRVNLALTEQFLNDRNYALAADLANETLKKYPERSVLGLNYAIALLKLGEYKKCVAFLESFVVIPFEGAVMGRNVYREASVKAALEELNREKYKNAIDYADKALLWPLNLGSGKPYITDERLENSIIAYCNKKLNRSSVASTYYSKVINYDNEANPGDNDLLYLQVLALKENKRENEAEALLDQALNEYPEDKYVRWARNMDSQGIANSMSEEIIRYERQTSPINNEFLLLTELLSIIQ